MFRNISKILSILLLATACSTHQRSPFLNIKTDSALAPAVSKKEVLRRKETVKGTTQVTAVRGKTYFLYGAEHLKLDNYYFDIPVVYNKATKKWIKYFTGRGRGLFERYAKRAGRFAPILGKILEDSGLPRDLIFLAMAESGFQMKAKSWAQAVGPWQFMSFTGKRFGLKQDWYLDERRDPIKSTYAAVAYLSKLYDEFGSWELASAAYNAGEGKIGRAIRRYKTDSFWRIRKGRYLKAETKNYVPKIMALAIIGKNLRAFGLDHIEFYETLDFEEVQVPGGIDLVQLAEDLELPFKVLQDLNPELLRWVTPPNKEFYALKLPVGQKEHFENCCSAKNYRAENFKTYSVRSGRSTLKAVARKFKIKSLKVLTELNPNVSSSHSLGRGAIIKLPFRNGQSLKAPMYADLYERPRKSVRRRRQYRRWIRYAQRNGKRIKNPKTFYTVKRGDTLWTVARRSGTKLSTLIKSNLRLVRNRMIRAGDRLIIR